MSTALYRKYRPDNFENIIGSIVHDKKLEHERRSPHNGDIALRETR